MEKICYEDLRLRDTGAWMGKRFGETHIAKFEDALRVARKYDIWLMLDINTKGIELEVMELARRQGMLDKAHHAGGCLYCLHRSFDV